jgi:hypothetical protein
MVEDKVPPRKAEGASYLTTHFVRIVKQQTRLLFLADGLIQPAKTSF